MLPAEEAEVLARFALNAQVQEPVFYIEVEGDDWIQAGRIPGSTFDFNELPDGINKLYAHPAPSVPAAVPGYVLMPLKLTAENGAKYALSGEFHVLHRVTCHECGGEGCSDCDDEGSFEEKIMIGWMTLRTSTELQLKPAQSNLLVRVMRTITVTVEIDVPDSATAQDITDFVDVEYGQCNGMKMDNPCRGDAVEVRSEMEVSKCKQTETAALAPP
jgi:hypothetical protein